MHQTTYLYTINCANVHNILYMYSCTVLYIPSSLNISFPVARPRFASSATFSQNALLQKSTTWARKQMLLSRHECHQNSEKGGEALSKTNSEWGKPPDSLCASPKISEPHRSTQTNAQEYVRSLWPAEANEQLENSWLSWQHIQSPGLTSERCHSTWNSHK